MARLRSFAPNSTHSVSSTFGGSETCADAWSVPAKTVRVDGSGNADVNTGCWAGNTSVGILVDGVVYDFGYVAWRRF
jgi:hypothetical protein